MTLITMKCGGFSKGSAALSPEMRDGATGHQRRRREPRPRSPFWCCLRSVEVPGGEGPLDPTDRMFYQPSCVQQVGRGLADLPPPPFSSRQRRTRDVLDVVLLIEDAFIRQGSLRGVDVREGP